MHAKCPAHLILDFISQIIFGVEFSSQSFSFCSLLHSPLTSSLLHPNILPSTLPSNTLSLCFYFNVRGRVSHPHQSVTTHKQTRHILICAFIGSKREDKKLWAKCQQTFSEFKMLLISLCMQFWLAGVILEGLTAVKISKHLLPVYYAVKHFCPLFVRHKYILSCLIICLSAKPLTSAKCRCWEFIYNISVSVSNNWQETCSKFNLCQSVSILASFLAPSIP